MVRQARSSIPLHDSAFRDLTPGGDAYEDLDELVGDDHLPPDAVQRRKSDRNTPSERSPKQRERANRRHLAGSDWLTDSGPTADD